MTSASASGSHAPCADALLVEQPSSEEEEGAVPSGEPLSSNDGFGGGGGMGSGFVARGETFFDGSRSRSRPSQ